MVLSDESTELPPFNGQERYDMSTFNGRYASAIALTDPRTLLASDTVNDFFKIMINWVLRSRLFFSFVTPALVVQEIREAIALLEQVAKDPSLATEENRKELWAAKSLKE